MSTDPRPLYQRIADELRDHIAAGTLKEGERAPSTNELSAFHSVNPTTAAKALTALHQEGLVEKRRGLGMFVTPTAREQILEQRRAHLARDYIRPLLREASALGLSLSDLIATIKHEAIERETTEHAATEQERNNHEDSPSRG
ncbi:MULTISPECIES: GntR family transcriptional regulator [unclassified Corynebacterium]|uniref:GntR family transcriptional regulator n=1 Tax=unclassified Corynebacterium TaxID=2624378 RepID=UPI0029CA0C37|nr:MULTISPECIES: GntR family transcriptional regulator [unclassified Corynebacterium]WPF66594.1 GntR family transcriptional regulator [Corynebacterium sp. 22KM0430]WPF69082.1 GntR family transcriptional regulator [Corynebacterium sp. 21KM1197]